MSNAENHIHLKPQAMSNLYRCLFALSFIFLIVLPITILSLRGWIHYQQEGTQGDITALKTDQDGLAQAIAADVNQIAALDNEERALTKSEQVFVEGQDQNSAWRADARWSEMGKARIAEIWARRQTIQQQLHENRDRQRETQLALLRLQAHEQQLTYLYDLIQNQRFMYYGILLLGAFSTSLAALLWTARIQARTNRILQKLSE